MTSESISTCDPCPLCGGDAFIWCRSPDRRYGLTGVWEVGECTVCRHRFQTPMPSEGDLGAAYPVSYYAHQVPVLDFTPAGLRRRGVWLRLHDLKYSRGYDHLAVRGNPGLALCARLIRRKPLHFGAPEFVPGGALLDYGSGAGDAVAFARHTGWDAAGIEMNGAAVDAGREAGLDLRQGSIEALEDSAERYDHIMSSHCVEHVPEVRRLFRALHAALKPNGTLAIDVPNGGSAAAERFKDRYYHLTLPLHVHFFNAATLRGVAQDAGFTDIQMGSYSRLAWHAHSQALCPTSGRDGRDRVELHKVGPAALFWARLLAVPSFLRSLRGLRGDCLVLVATKAKDPKGVGVGATSRGGSS